MAHKRNEEWEENRKPLLTVLVIWVLSSPIFTVLLLFVSPELFLIYVGGWIVIQFLFAFVLAVLGGWQIALGVSVLLLLKLLLPVTMLALFLPLPNPLTVVFLYVRCHRWCNSSQQY